MAEKSTGNCYICGATLGKTAVKNHLLKHYEADEDGKACSLLKIEGTDDKQYWLYIDVPTDRTLKYVDEFLRKIWLECCEHMSEFIRSNHDELGMNQKIGSFPAGDTFSHHYDFGSTTETTITVIGSVMRKPQRGIVRLLARNTPPVFQCRDCGEPADFIYAEPDDDNQFPFYCTECSEKIDEDSNYLLYPVTNSPRMGVCGYEGEDDDRYTFDPVTISYRQELAQKSASSKGRKKDGEPV